MPEFQYIARDLQGSRFSGALSAASERDAVAQLTQKSLFPVEIKVGTESSGPALNVFGSKRVGGHVLANFYGQLAALLRSGVPLLRSLRLLRDQSSNVRLKEVLSDVHERVEDGSSLAVAMRRHPKVFRKMTSSMVDAGTEGGFLEDALERIAAFTEEQEDLKSRTAGALAYPAFVAVFGVSVVTGLMMFIVPRFAKTFERMRDAGELPGMTKALLAVSGVMNQYWWLILIVSVASIILLQRQIATPRGSRMWDAFILRLPQAGTIFRNLAIGRFCRVLGTLLANGVPLLRSLQISREATGNEVLAEVIDTSAEDVSEGKSLAQTLVRSDHFPAEICEMVSVAEESNSLDTVLINISERLERRTSRRLDLFVRLLEPLMLLILATVVGGVMLALLLPIMKMSSTL